MTRRRAPRRIVAAVLLAATGSGTGSAVATTIVYLETDPDAVRVMGEGVAQNFGAVMSACDINGDGIEDLVLSAVNGRGPGDVRGNAGRVSIIYGRRGAWHGPLDVASIRAHVIYGASSGDSAGQGIECNDLDGDGSMDLALAVPWGDGPGETRLQSGEVTVLFDAKSLPFETDLATKPGTLVYGDAAGDRASDRSVEIADLNRDGRQDLVIGANNAYGSSSLRDRAGRVYIVFGRATWPATLDLRTDANVTILGRASRDSLGMDLAVGDMDEDGRLDLVTGAGAATPPLSGRTQAGEVYVFKSRATWPATIDLFSSAPDVRIYGSDPNDGFGGFHSLDIADLDGDGHIEFILSASSGDGRSNSALQTGEIYRYQPYPGFLSQVDIRTRANTTIYGVDEQDLYAAPVVGDVNGDGRPDLVGRASGKGPANQYTYTMGEISVFFGRPSWPVTADATESQVDVMVYGRAEGPNLGLRAVADINGDGLAEIIGLSDLGSEFLNESFYLVSPFDVDGDGISQLPDNCPLVANPAQADGDGDGRGDACALDWDGDGVVDAQDCAPAKADAGKPPAIGGVRFAAGTKELIAWNASVLAARYDVSRGALPRTGDDDYGSCQNARDPNLADTQFPDPEVPQAGKGFFYLVRGWNALCGGSGSWGTTSAGVERVNGNPAQCP